MSASIFNSSAVKLLKDILKFKSGHQIITGDTDNPTSVAKAGSPGFMYFRAGTNEVYTKADSGTTTNWTLLSTSAAGITQLTGDVTAGPGSGSQAATIASDAVSNSKLANMATQTIKGRTTAGTGDPEDLSATQATAILNNVVGDSGSGGTKGLVPAPAAGDAAAVKYLKADGTWATIPSLTSVVKAVYKTAAGSTYGNGYSVVDFGTSVIDTASIVTTGASWHATIGTAGYYQVTASVGAQSASWTADDIFQLDVRVNGTTMYALHSLKIQASGTYIYVISGASPVLNLSVNDTVDVRLYNGRAGGNISLLADGTYNWISIHGVQ